MTLKDIIEGYDKGIVLSRSSGSPGSNAKLEKERETLGREAYKRVNPSSTADADLDALKTTNRAGYDNIVQTGFSEQISYNLDRTYDHFKANNDNLKKENKKELLKIVSTKDFNDLFSRTTFSADKKNGQIIQDYLNYSNFKQIYDKVEANITAKKDAFEGIDDKLEESLLKQMATTAFNKEYDSFRKKGYNEKRSQIAAKFAQAIALASPDRIKDSLKNLLDKEDDKLKKYNEVDSSGRVTKTYEDKIIDVADKVMSYCVNKSGDEKVEMNAIDLMYSASNDFKYRLGSRSLDEVFP